MEKYDWIQNLDEDDLEERGFKCIGEGSSRIVYAIDNKTVVKIAKNEIGNSQNLIEYQIYNNASEEEKTVLAPIYEEYRAGYMILMARALTKNQKVDDHSLHILERIINEFDLLEDDIVSEESWGIIEEQFVCIDYGCTNDIRNEYDDTMLRDIDED